MIPINRLFLLLMLLFLPAAALAGTLDLPASLTTIGSEAFAGCASVEELLVSSSVTEIGEQMFSGVSDPVLIRTSPGSCAMNYALTSGMDFRAGTICRALLVGQCHYSDTNVMPGTLNDTFSMEAMLLGSSEPWQVTRLSDLTADQLRQAILDAFAEAQPQDISLLYYSGHGSAWGGSLLCVGDGVVTAAELRGCLDQIPGRKVIIVDACYSGGLIGRGGTVSDPAGFVNAFTAAFSAVGRNNLAAESLYYVMTSSHSTQTSKEATTNGVSYGLFTYYLAQGSGFDLMKDSVVPRSADADADGVVSFMEAFRYARIHANNVNPGQTAQVWPADCGRFGLLR